jgi:hypothetical protein
MDKQFKPSTGQLIINDSEEKKLERRLAMTHEERFFLMMKLMRAQKLMKAAVIVHK